MFRELNPIEQVTIVMLTSLLAIVICAHIIGGLT